MSTAPQWGPGLALLGLVLSAGVAHRLGRVGALALAVCSVLWLWLNKPLEGGQIVVLSPDHGLNVTDLAGLAGLGIAGWVALTARR